MPNFFRFANVGLDREQIAPRLRIRKHRSLKCRFSNSSQNPNRTKASAPRLQKLNPRRDISRQSNKMPSTLARVFPERGSEGEGRTIHGVLLMRFQILTQKYKLQQLNRFRYDATLVLIYWQEFVLCASFELCRSTPQYQHV